MYNKFLNVIGFSIFLGVKILFFCSFVALVASLVLDFNVSVFQVFKVIIGLIILWFIICSVLFLIVGVFKFFEK